MAHVIDLRSDTVTRPTEPMREAMARALVGDDVFGEDPTVRALEDRIAALLGKEAALFVTSGTMGNQLAILTSTRRGDEVVCGEGAHLAWYEAGAGGAIGGVQFAAAGRGGLFTAEDLEHAMKPPVYYYPRTSLVAVENTHNRAGGRVFPQREILRIAERAKARGLAMHLDGARLWNASVATGQSLHELAEPFDTVSICFSKGLGAPVGSAFCSTASRVADARRLRKMLGGGMRQAGILAAAALFAIEHHVDRLADDHERAKMFADRLAVEAGAAGVAVAPPETNIVLVDLPCPAAERVAARAGERDVLVSVFGPARLRAVFHLDVAAEAALEGASRLGLVIREVCGER